MSAFDETYSDFRLTPEERMSGLWNRLSTYLDTKLEQRRRENDSPALSPEQTAALRGHIRCLKGLIALGKEPPIDG